MADFNMRSMRKNAMTTQIRLVEMREETRFAVLGAVGYCLTRTGFLGSIWKGLNLGQKIVDHDPAEKLMDLLVSIMAGSRSVSAVNTLIRPDLALALAWGRQRFAEQSTLMRTLDCFDEPALRQLRQGSERLFRQQARVFEHDFSASYLLLDIDLSPLPISKYAEGSTKGKFAKKTAMDDNSHACMRPSIMRRYSPISTLGSGTVPRPIFHSLTPWKPPWALRSSRKRRRLSAPTVGSAAIATLTTP
jgi:hypothetical protein